LPTSLRSDVSIEFLQSILNDVVGAIKAGVFVRSGDKHLSWTPGLFGVGVKLWR
jgi:hypothetical protein